MTTSPCLPKPETEFTAELSGRVFFAKRIGWRWQVWYAHRDGTVEENGSAEWLACSVLYWRRINADRAANSMWRAFNEGVWCETGRRTALAKAHGRTREAAE